jgi:hypothetical protein
MYAETIPLWKSVRVMVNFTKNAPQIATLAWPSNVSGAAWREMSNKL